MAKSSCYRQGDVFLASVEKMADHAERQHRHGVPAEGEVTAHSHHFADPAKADDGPHIDVLVEGTDLVGQEHGTIHPSRGAYQVRIQSEHTPKGIRRVVD